jgi:hypothetical protein
MGLETLGLRPGALAGATRVAAVPARTRIERRDQHEIRRKATRRFGPTDRDRPILERLSHDFERPPLKLRKFVEEKNPVVVKYHTM